MKEKGDIEESKCHDCKKSIMTGEGRYIVHVGDSLDVGYICVNCAEQRRISKVHPKNLAYGGII